MPEVAISEWTELASIDYQHATNLSILCSAANSTDESRKRNRYRLVKPFDHNRVIIQRGQGYINASFISPLDDGCAFIATQAPMNHTMGDFCSMLVEYQVKNVITLGGSEEEMKRDSFYCYWADSRSYCGYEMVVSSPTRVGTWMNRTIDIYKDGSLLSTTVHVHFHQWLDVSVPNEIQFNDFLRYLEAERLVGYGCGELPPTVIHCSAGVGRTGTLICGLAIRKLLKYGAGLKKTVETTHDVFQIVKNMKNQRILTVQTAEQYMFLRRYYDFILSHKNRKEVNHESTAG